MARMTSTNTKNPTEEGSMPMINEDTKAGEGMKDVMTGEIVIETGTIGTGIEAIETGTDQIDTGMVKIGAVEMIGTTEIGGIVQEIAIIAGEEIGTIIIRSEKTERSGDPAQGLKSASITAAPEVKVRILLRGKELEMILLVKKLCDRPPRKEWQ